MADHAPYEQFNCPPPTEDELPADLLPLPPTITEYRLDAIFPHPPPMKPKQQEVFNLPPAIVEYPFLPGPAELLKPPPINPKPLLFLLLQPPTIVEKLYVESFSAPPTTTAAIACAVFTAPPTIIE